MITSKAVRNKTVLLFLLLCCLLLSSCGRSVNSVENSNTAIAEEKDSRLNEEDQNSYYDNDQTIDTVQEMTYAYELNIIVRDRWSDARIHDVTMFYTNETGDMVVEGKTGSTGKGTFPCDEGKFILHLEKEGYLPYVGEIDISEDNLDREYYLFPKSVGNEAYVELEWEKNDFDLILYNAGTNEIIRYYNEKDSLGNVLRSDDSKEDGKEVLKIADIYNPSVMAIYVVNSQGTKEVIEESNISVTVYVNNESIYEYSCKIADPTLWSVGYFQNGQFISSESFENDFYSIMWANVSKNQRVKTFDEMGRGIWLVEGMYCYSLDEKNPNSYKINNRYGYYNSIFVSAEDYNKNIIPTITKDTIFYIKGDTVGYPYVYKYPYYGYTYNAAFSSGGIYLYNIDKTYGNISTINGNSMDAYDYVSQWEDNGGVSIMDSSVYSSWGNWYILLGNISRDDSLTFGYFSGTEYFEKELSADIWYADQNKNLYSRVIQMDVTETKNGYFEMRIDAECTPGLYALYLWGNLETPLLVWLE